MPNLLITGGAGFIGGNFVHYWSSRHPEDQIFVLDALTYAGRRATLDGALRTELIHGSICDKALVETILRERNIRTIVHFAAESHVDRSIAGPDPFIDTNISGTYTLLKAAQSVWLTGSGREHRFHHISTDEVFGSLQAGDAPFTEASPYRPNSPYSASKAASDHLVRAYHRTFGMDVSTSHCSNNYGPYQHPEKLIPRFIINALQGRQLPIYGDGLSMREWLHVEDHCAGIDKCLSMGKTGESYNIGGGTELSNLTVTQAICEEIDRAFIVNPGLALRFPDAPPARGRQCEEFKTFVVDRAGHDRRYALDNSKAWVELGYSAKRSFEEGLSETLAWYLDNEVWWRSLSPA